MRLFSFVILILVSTNIHAQFYDAGCIERTKEGTFYGDEEVARDYVVVRKRNKQTESCMLNGKTAKMTLKIDWTGVTTYTITPTKYSNFPSDYPRSYEPIDVTIIGCKQEYYTIQVNVDGQTLETKFYFSEN